LPGRRNVGDESERIYSRVLAIGTQECAESDGRRGNCARTSGTCPGETSIALDLAYLQRGAGRAQLFSWGKTTEGIAPAAPNAYGSGSLSQCALTVILGAGCQNRSGRPLARARLLKMQSTPTAQSPSPLRGTSQSRLVALSTRTSAACQAAAHPFPPASHLKVHNMLDLMGVRVLVVGGGGFMGQHAVRALLRSGAEVRVLDTSARRSMASAEDDQRLHWIVGDATSDVTIAEAAHSCRIVIFLANVSLPGTSNSDIPEEISSHVYNTLKAAEVCAAQGVERFVFSSSGGTVYGVDSATPLSEDAVTVPKNAYGVSKLAIELYLRILRTTRSMRTLSLRIANPYGEGQLASRGQGFVAAVMEHIYFQSPLPIWGDGSTIRDFVYVGDVADAFVKAARYRGDASVLNVGSGIGHSLNQIIAKAERITGRQVNAKRDASRAIDVRSNILGITAIRKELQWKPVTGIDEGLEQTAEWWDRRSSV
jgi:UDP-glucose 4-epimerase